MVKQSSQTILLVAISLLFCNTLLTSSLPLSTKGRWVMDVGSGRRMKLHCVNWAAHMETVLAEGLDKKPLADIASSVSSLGFNCVRLTWATFMFTDTLYADLTVAKSLDSLGLGDAVAGISKNNPSLLNLTVIQAYDAVVDALGAQGIMVVLDNHVSQPQWCCSNDDGNGFFGDKYFDPDMWLQGLTIVAKRFMGKAQVVGMSLRNELHGPRQSESDWYQYMPVGARMVHESNPNVLVIVSGLNYDTDLSFLKTTPLQDNLNNKLVLEAHWYAFSDGRQGEWEEQSSSDVCAGAIARFDERAGFVAQSENGVPLFLSEFGMDQTGSNQADDRFLSCILSFLAERDLDWGLWALQGSYYLRDNRAGYEETYGVLDVGWDGPRNSKFHERFGLIQEMMQGKVPLVRKRGSASSFHLKQIPANVIAGSWFSPLLA